MHCWSAKGRARLKESATRVGSAMHLASRLLETYPAGGKGAKRRRTWGRFTEMAVLGILANLVHFRDVGRGHIYRGLNGTQRVLSWINVFLGPSGAWSEFNLSRAKWTRNHNLSGGFGPG